LHTDGHPAKEENSATASRHKRTASTIYTRRTGSKSFVWTEDKPEPPPSPNSALEDDTGEEKLEELPLWLYKDLPPRSQAPLHPPSPQGTPEERGLADRRRKGEIAFRITQECCSLGKEKG
jgi:hypothetical protein